MTYTMYKDISAVLLAAGKGVRFKSSLPKVMHSITDKPMIYYPLRALLRAGIKDIIVVAGFGSDYVKDYIREEFKLENIRFVIQKEQMGTGDAVRVALPYVKTHKFLLLYGDMPLIDESVIKRLIKNFGDSRLALTSFEIDNPIGYGRVIRDTSNNLARIVEEKDATLREKDINEVNAGLYLVETETIRKYIKWLKSNNAQNEYYFPDVFMLAIRDGITAKVFKSDKEYLLGANNRAELAYLTKILQHRINTGLMLSGVTIINPESVLIGPDVDIKEDVIIYPDVFISGLSKIASGSVIEKGSIISNATIYENVRIKAYSYIESSEIKKGAIIGPFARIRPESVIDEEVHIGNFVELKKTYIGKRSKANHLSYLGDAEIGSDVNIGAGTITCNYDGKKKYKTVLLDGVFVGSDTQFVAPVTVGSDAYIGAGSTITKDVPAGSLALSRTPQTNIKDWVYRHKKK